MRIGIDFDGTIADASSAKIRYALERFGVELTPELTMRPGGVPVIGLERYEAMVADIFGTELTLEFEPMPGALEVLRRLAAEHEIYVVTARLDHEVDLAARWLETRGVEVRGVRHTARGPKTDACRELGLGLYLDDTPAELARLAEGGLCEAGLCAALLETPYNREDDRHAAVRLVPDWPAFEVLCAETAGEVLA
jgi:uncharacterized HAD superfamily protein